MVVPGSFGEREKCHGKAALVKPLVTVKTKALVLHVQSHRAELGHEDSYTNGLVEGKWGLGDMIFSICNCYPFTCHF